MKVQFSLVFDRKKQVKAPSQKGLVELRAYQNATAKYFSTKIQVRPSEWNEPRQEVHGKHPESTALNIQLRKMMSIVEDKQAEAYFKKQNFTLSDVKAIIRNKKQQTQSYIDFVYAELAGDNLLHKITKYHQKNTLKKLVEFNKGDDVLFSDLNLHFIDGFLNYLRAKKYSINTVCKHFKNIKKYIDLAINKEYIEGKNPCKSLTVKTEDKPRDVLTEKHIESVEKLIFSVNDTKLKQVRDMFLFACYTGLRISDVIGLKTDYVKENDKGFELDFFTQKVNKHAVLPLYILFPVTENKSKPEQILTQYFNKENILVFPKLSDQYINRQLKLIATLAEIGFNLTFHIGRATFSTYMANKLPTPVLMQLLQHSELKTTMRYVHLNDKMIKEQLIKVDWS
jgi:integrase